MSEYIVELDSKHSIALKIAFAEEMRGGDFVRGEIVRCRDCKHVKHDPEWQPDRRFKPVDMWTCHAEWCEGFEGDHPQVEPDGFCAWGERK